MTTSALVKGLNGSMPGAGASLRAGDAIPNDRIQSRRDALPTLAGRGLRGLILGIALVAALLMLMQLGSGARVFYYQGF